MKIKIQCYNCNSEIPISNEASRKVNLELVLVVYPCKNCAEKS